MPQSLCNVLLHVVYSTKHRQRFLQDAEIRSHLNSYSVGVLQNLNCPSLEINGVEDHIHILCQLGRTITIAELVRELKTATSKWLKQQHESVRLFEWQAGYGVFSVSQSNVPEVRHYIQQQEAHHHRMSYQEEYRLLCQRHGIEIDERYVWD
jgi:putative transposase